MRVFLAPVLLLLAVSVPGSYALATNEEDASPSPQAQIEKLQTQMNAAIARVKTIVNQPVTHMPRYSDMQVTEYHPGWFHAGAVKPDFNTVDIRTTQEFPYSKYDYVTSNLNPGIVFIGSELEFNRMTKYFYTDLSVPKRKLSDAQMIEINKLYRIIGRDEKEIAQLEIPAPPASHSFLKSPYVSLALELLLTLAVFLILYRKLYRR